MTLPIALLPLVDAEVLGSLRTAGTVVFTDTDGTELSASIWFVVCPTRCWLVAGSREDRFAVASPRVSLDKGWTRDDVRVGPWTIPLRTGTRKEAVHLLASWKGGDGDEVGLPAAPVGATPVAHGAVVPGWIAAEVPEVPEARWLYAYESTSTHAFPGVDGTPERLPLWVAVSDHGVWLAARGGFSRPVQTLEDGGRSGLREQVVADGRALAGALVDRRRDALLTLAATPPLERWGAAMQLALEDKQSERAAKLAAEAFLLERFASCWRWLGAMAWAAGDHRKALQAAFMDPGPPLEAAAAWGSFEPAELPAGPFAEVDLPGLPEGMPAPKTPIGMNALAAILRGETEVGLEAWSKVRGPRPTSARAAVEATADAWIAAARAWRPTDPSRAAKNLDRAIDIEPSPEALYLAGAWAHTDGRAAEGYWRRAFPAPPPPDLQQTQATWKALARVAEGEALLPAVAAWRALGTPSLLWRSAQALRDELAQPELALTVLQQRLDLEDPEVPRWQVLRAIASLQHQLDQGPDALLTLRELVTNDFLVPEALEAALHEGADKVPAEELARWAHLRAQLDGSTAPPPDPHDLDAAQLDRLHPGGVGWMERTRHRLDTSEAPPTSQLVRGLEVLSERTWPELVTLVETLAGRLDLTPPPVYLFRGQGAWGMSAWPTSPPLLLVGHDHLAEGHPQHLGDAALRFSLAVELAHLAARHPLLAFDKGIVGTSRSVYETFGAYADVAETTLEVVSLLPGIDQIAKIQTLVRLSGKMFTARTVLDKATKTAKTGEDWLKGKAEDSVGRSFKGAALQFRLQADRAAWWITGDLRAAIDAMLAAHPSTTPLRAVFAERGVLPVLETAPPDLKLRIASLLGYVASVS